MADVSRFSLEDVWFMISKKSSRKAKRMDPPPVITEDIQAMGTL